MTRKFGKGYLLSAVLFYNDFLYVLTCMQFFSGDARSLLRDKKIRMVKQGGDARDILAGLAKNTDARKRLLKNRLMKRGIADAKTTKKGGITIITTTTGKLQLSTKRSKGMVVYLLKFVV